MFWDSAPQSNMDNLLAAPTPCLYSILEDEYVVQDVRVGKRNLLEFLLKDKNILIMICECFYPLTQQSNPLGQYFYSQKIVNVIQSFSQKELTMLIQHHKFMSLLSGYLIVDHERKNDLTISFYMTIIETLFKECTEEMCFYMRDTHLLVDGILSSIDVGAVYLFFETCFSFSHTFSQHNLVQEIFVKHKIIDRLIDGFYEAKSVRWFQNTSIILLQLTTQLKEKYACINMKEDLILKNLLSGESVSRLIELVVDPRKSGTNYYFVLNNCAKLLSDIIELYENEMSPSKLYSFNSSRMQTDVSGLKDKYDYTQKESALSNFNGEAYKTLICRRLAEHIPKLFDLVHTNILHALIDNEDTKKVPPNDPTTGYYVMKLIASIFNNNDPRVHEIACIELMKTPQNKGIIDTFFKTVCKYEISPVVECVIKSFLRNILFYCFFENDSPDAIFMYDIVLKESQIVDIITNANTVLDAEGCKNLPQMKSFLIGMLKIIYDSSKLASRKDKISKILDTIDGVDLIEKMVADNFMYVIFDQFDNEFLDKKYLEKVTNQLVDGVESKPKYAIINNYSNYANSKKGSMKSVGITKSTESRSFTKSAAKEPSDRLADVFGHVFLDYDKQSDKNHFSSGSLKSFNFGRIPEEPDTNSNTFDTDKLKWPKDELEEDEFGDFSSHFSQNWHDPTKSSKSEEWGSKFEDDWTGESANKNSGIESFGEFKNAPSHDWRTGFTSFHKTEHNKDDESKSDNKFSALLDVTDPGSNNEEEKWVSGEDFDSFLTQQQNVSKDPFNKDFSRSEEWGSKFEDDWTGESANKNSGIESFGEFKNAPSHDWRTGFTSFHKTEHNKDDESKSDNKFSALLDVTDPGSNNEEEKWVSGEDFDSFLTQQQNVSKDPFNKDFSRK
uniref:Beige/BEACH domain containing protein n=1 Tax=Rhabditophanes sp. KR3021 TaxID=114890 RepID=A0AC35TYE5_9BILA